MLTNATVKAARPGVRRKKLWDEGGLHLLVLPSGQRSWRLRIRAGGQESVVTIGSWPDLQLDEARDRARMLRGGGSLAVITAARTFETAARAWHGHMLEQWSPVHAADVLASLERDVLPAIGDVELGAIAQPMVLAAVRAVERRGRRETAGRLRQRISAVFEFAMSEGWCDANPAMVVRRAMLRPGAQRHHPALTDIASCRQLLADVDQLAGAPVAKLASRFLALTGMRWAAVRGARWSEVKDLDGDAPLWRVPAARMKLLADKKDSADHDHLVPLAPAAVAVLRQAHRFAGAGNLIFPGRGRELGEGAIGALYVRAGYAGRHVPHGWRASFSTILNEAAPADRQLVDHALGHALRAEDGRVAKVEGAYNRATHLDERRRLFTNWAELLTG